MGSSGYNTLYSRDGFVTYSGPEETSGVVRAFSTLFRNGSAECVSSLNLGNQDGKPSLSLTAVEEYILNGTNSAVRVLDRHSVSIPYYIMASLVGVRGIYGRSHGLRERICFPYRADSVLMPEFLLNERDINDNSLRPILDLLWNAFGWEGSPNFNSDGSRRRR